jgi:pilus assembly protein CpaF
MTRQPPPLTGLLPSQRTPAEYALLETVLRTRAALLEQTSLDSDELRERLYAAMRDEVELAQRRAAAANDPLLPDPADTRQWLDDQVLGFAELGPLMRSDSVQTIRILGPHHLYVVDNGHQHRLAGVRFRNDQAVRELVKRFASQAGRLFDDAHPRVDFALPDGSRLHAAMPPITPQYTEVTIRRFTLLDRRIESLVPETLTAGCCAFLQSAVRARANILLCGDGGTGKTTMQRMLLLGVDDPDEWMICLETTRELQLHRLLGRVQSWQSRDDGTDGSGAITLGQLLEDDALRCEATRIVVGECRGAETYTLLSACETGHRGTVTSIHARSAADALERLLTAARHSPLAPGEDVLRDMIRRNIDLVIYVRKLHGVRLVAEVVEVDPTRRLDGGGFATRPLWLRKGNGPLRRQPYPPKLLEEFEDQDIGFRWQEHADEEAAA